MLRHYPRNDDLVLLVSELYYSPYFEGIIFDLAQSSQRLRVIHHCAGYRLSSCRLPLNLVSQDMRKTMLLPAPCQISQPANDKKITVRIFDQL
jgi:hypothetical protein